MDFNTQRKVVKALENKGRNPLLFIPCIIAKYAVILFMSAWRGIDMALSDKNGYFLGIKHERRTRTPDYSREMKKLEKRTERKMEAPSAEKIRRVPHRPFYLRAASFVMAFAFAFMILPGMDTLALETTAAGPVIGQTLVLTDKQIITGTDMGNSRADISRLEIRQTIAESTDIEKDTFINMPLLTSVALEYSNTLAIGSNNFTKIAPDASIYVNVPTRDMYNETVSKLGSAGTLAVWDMNGQITRDHIPGTISEVKSASGLGSVVLTWAPVSNADGYRVYRYSNGIYTHVDNAVISAGADLCRAEIPSGTSDVYAVRAYNNLSVDFDSNGAPDETGKVFSAYFCNAKPSSSLTTGIPSITASNTGKDISVKLTMSAGCDLPSYAVLFASENNGAYIPVKYFSANDLAYNNTVYTDTYKGVSVNYRAAVYYDVFGKNNKLALSDYSLPSVNPYVEQDYQVILSDIQTISNAKISAPENFKCTLSDDKSTWNLSWNLPLDSANIPAIAYTLYADKTDFKVTTDSNTYAVPVINTLIPQGQDVEFRLFASAPKDNSLENSEEVSVKVAVEENSVKLSSATVSDESVTVTITNPQPSAKYTLHILRDGTSALNAATPANESQVIFTELDSGCSTDPNTGYLHYTYNGLASSESYSFYVTSNLGLYPSAILPGIPAYVPDAPDTVTCVGKDTMADITWSSVNYRDDTLVTGYILNVKEYATNTMVIRDVRILSPNNYYEARGLTNNVEYVAEIYSYIATTSGSIIRSAYPAVSLPFTPAEEISNINNLSAIPDNDKHTITLKWDKVAGITDYKVVRTDPEGNTEEYYLGDKNTFTDAAVDNNVLYTYVVFAIRVVNGTAYAGFGQEVTAKIVVTLDKVKGLTATGKDTSIILKWDKVADADGYYVEYNDNGTWVQIGNVSKPTYTHENVINNHEYKYRVTPYVEVNSKIVYDYNNSETVLGKAGDHLPAPTGFTATVEDNDVTLKWDKVPDADGYEIFVISPSGEYILIDRVSKVSAVHENVPDGTTISYVVRAYKIFNGANEPGDYSVTRTVTIGEISLNAPTDVTATGGKGQVSLKWKKVDGADGYVVYCFNSAGYQFQAVGIVTTTSFVHTGLFPSTPYTYMVAAYKNVDSQPHYSAYSIAVTAITDAETSSNVPIITDYRIFITGTTPYGMSNSDLISAYAERGAVSSDIDVRFTVSGDTVTSVQNVLQYYGNGIESFLIYPMDIALYVSGTDARAALNPGYFLTLTIPVPDMLLPYSDKISVIHVSDNDQLEILPATHVNAAGVDCMQFTATSFSPFAFVVYLPEFAEDTGSDMGMTAQGTVGYQTTSGAPALMCTYLPDFIRSRRKNMTYRIKMTKKM